MLFTIIEVFLKAILCINYYFLPENVMRSCKIIVTDQIVKKGKASRCREAFKL